MSKNPDFSFTSPDDHDDHDDPDDPDDPDDLDDLPPPKPTLKHRHSHYHRTRNGNIMERFVLEKDVNGQPRPLMDIVDPRTGERRRQKVRRYDKLPGMIKVAAGIAGTPPRRRKNASVREGGEGGEMAEIEESEGGRQRKKKKGKGKCGVM